MSKRGERRGGQVSAVHRAYYRLYRHVSSHKCIRSQQQRQQSTRRPSMSQSYSGIKRNVARYAQIQSINQLNHIISAFIMNICTTTWVRIYSIIKHKYTLIISFTKPRSLQRIIEVFS
jgi:hypothetical protein